MVGQGFSTYTDLQAHIKAEHPPGCQHCGLLCSSARELQRHIDIHHAGIPLAARRSFICTINNCGKGFTKQGNLNIHIRTVHAQDKSFGCGSMDVSSLATDLITWSGINACGRSFGTKHALEGHIRTQHFGKEEMPPPPPLNKKQLRQLKKAANDAQPNLTTFAKLTGAGYVEESGRAIACVVEGCEFLFKRTIDLEAHAKATHDLSPETVTEMILEREALQDGQFWIGQSQEVNINGQAREQEDEDVEWQSFLDLGEEERHEAGSANSARVHEGVFSGEEALQNIDFQALMDYRGEEQAMISPQVCIDPALMSA